MLSVALGAAALIRSRSRWSAARDLGGTCRRYSSTVAVTGRRRAVIGGSVRGLGQNPWDAGPAAPALGARSGGSGVPCAISTVPPVRGVPGSNGPLCSVRGRWGTRWKAPEHHPTSKAWTPFPEDEGLMPRDPHPLPRAHREGTSAADPLSPDRDRHGHRDRPGSV